MASLTNPYNFYAYALYLTLTLLATRLLHSLFTRATKNPLPPGPTPIPIFGNLFQLGPAPHQRLASLASLHGPLMSLRLGSLPAVVLSDSSAVRDVFSDNDVALSNRGVYDANTALNHHEFSILWLPNGPRWRHLRKISNSHVFSGASLDLSRHLRERKVSDLLDFLRRRADESAAVDVGEAAFNLSLNFMSNSIFSIDLADPSSETSREFKQLMRDISEAIGKPNLADFLPWLRPFDPQGIRRKVAKHLKKMIVLIDGLIGDRISGKSGVAPESEQDMLGVLLKFSREEDSEINRPFIVHILMDLFMGGTDTSSSTIEYAMAELIRNPEKMKKLREELDKVIGKGNPIHESDIPNLPYLQAVMKETLRVHPPIPLASRRTIDTDIKVRGYNIEKETRVWVNLWAIGRDPKVWPDPLSFEPERHLGSESDYRSKNFEVIPFGMGRRICPGLPLVTRMGPLVLGSLIHSFDWKLEGMAKPESLDMEEEFGVTVQKAVPLRAIPVRV